MALPVEQDGLCAVVASGDKEAVGRLVREGCDVNQCSEEGFHPLCIAAFWGYADIVKVLLEAGANVNVANRGTGWTAAHCAAFQGHGKVMLCLLNYKPDVTIADSMGRTAADFGSALESIWPFFAAMGCRRTSKAELIRMDIVRKVERVKDQSSAAGSLQRMKEVSAHFSRPGSSYVLQAQALHDSHRAQASATALAFGDVLRPQEQLHSSTAQHTNISPQMNIYRN